jgi:predicted phage-related endonuclease
MIARIPIENREQWLALRQRDITASVAGALLGVHDYITPYGLYALKSGLIAEDPEESPQMRRGRLLEPVAIQMLRENNPSWIDVEPPLAYYRDEAARLGATPDVLAFDGARGRGVVQIKSVEGSIFRRKWTDDTGEISPPLAPVVQANVEAHLTGAEWAAVAALVVGFGIDLHLIEIPIHRRLIDRIKAEVAAFWDRIERRDPYPPDYARDGWLIAKLYSETERGTTIDLTSDNALPGLAAEDAHLAEEVKERTARRAAIKSEIIAKIGDAETALFQGGRISAKLISRKEYTVSPTRYRDVRIKLMGDHP